MLKKIFWFIKKFLFAFCVLYGLNVMVASLEVIIPINILTLLSVAFLEFPGLCMIIIMFLII